MQFFTLLAKLYDCKTEEEVKNTLNYEEFRKIFEIEKPGQSKDTAKDKKHKEKNETKGKKDKQPEKKEKVVDKKAKKPKDDKK